MTKSQYIIEKDNAIISLLYNIIFPGFGTILAGKIALGITQLLVFILSFIISIITIGFLGGIGALLLLITFSTWVWGLVTSIIYLSNSKFAKPKPDPKNIPKSVRWTAYFYWLNFWFFILMMIFSILGIASSKNDNGYIILIALITSIIIVMIMGIFYLIFTYIVTKNLLKGKYWTRRLTLISFYPSLIFIFPYMFSIFFIFPFDILISIFGFIFSILEVIIVWYIGFDRKISAFFGAKPFSKTAFYVTAILVIFSLIMTLIFYYMIFPLVSQIILSNQTMNYTQ